MIMIVCIAGSMSMCVVATFDHFKRCIPIIMLMILTLSLEIVKT